MNQPGKNLVDTGDDDNGAAGDTANDGDYMMVVTTMRGFMVMMMAL